MVAINLFTVFKREEKSLGAALRPGNPFPSLFFSSPKGREDGKSERRRKRKEEEEEEEEEKEVGVASSRDESSFLGLFATSPPPLFPSLCPLPLIY